MFLIVGLSVLGTSRPLGAFIMALAVYRGAWVAWGLVALLSPDDEEDES
ncbi:MAG: hypothetical protein H6736_03475 [Alphaproteobacteria bacterium]|nr:hypothetical protein [Alphaproteobacteria bacterium]MCB9690856.1 hypothetical protein [Alphaproteobacteria bacterium]